MRLAAAYLALLAAGAAASRLLLQHVPARFHVDMLQPVPVATNWHAFGLTVWTVIAATLCAATIPYLLMLRALARERVRMTPLAVLALGAAALAVLWAVAPLLSSDAYAYAAYGEMARTGINPYAAPVSHSTDPIVAAAIWQWSGTLPVCVYGELFVRIAQAVVTAMYALGPAAAIDALRVLACIVFLAAAYLLGVLRTDKRQNCYTVALVAWNPVLLWCAVEGHNDALMLAVALAGIALARRSVAAGVLLASLAALIKIPAAVVPAGIAAVYARRSASPARPFAYLAIGALIVAAASYRWILALFTHVAAHGRYFAAASLQGLTTTLFPSFGIAAALVVTACAIALALKTPGSIERCIAVAIALWLLVPNPYAWYGFWLVPAFAWLEPARARYAAAALTLSTLLRYVPDAYGAPPAAMNAAISAAALALYLVVFTMATVKQRQA